MNENKSQRVICDYYIIAVLGIEDNEECSVTVWCDEQFESKEAEYNGRYYCLRDREQNAVLTWIKKTFEPNPDFYVCVIEQRSKKHAKMNFTVEELIYLSPRIYKRINWHGEKLNLVQLLDYYGQQLGHLIAEDQRKTLLEKRRKQRG